MKLSDFDFELPKNLIAQQPAEPRDHSRLLIFDRKAGSIIDDYFYNLEKYLPAKTTLVLNDSKVEKARLIIGETEIFVLETINPNTIKALVRPGRKFKLGKPTILDTQDGTLSIETIDISDEGIRTLQLDMPINDHKLDPYRRTPLPPYIAHNEALSNRYQTVYAKPVGSKAAPTAGLHFTDKQLLQIAQNHPIAKLTLHVGLGTFAPVKTIDITKHKMHSEQFMVSKEAAELLNEASSVTAVGTTSLRVLESIQKPFMAATGSTGIFITPGYKFKNVDYLITNFHLPKSTLLMLVAALIGSVGEMQRVYSHAIIHKYRFYSFGDAMLIV